MAQEITWEERVDARIDRREANACWPWLGALEEGKPYLRPRRAIPFVYSRAYGKVPAGFVVARADHVPECVRATCAHNLCMNPAHMTIERRQRRKGRPPAVVCKRGHDLTDPDNVYVAGTRRWCLICKRVAREDWERRNPTYQKRYRARRRKNGPKDSQDVAG
jgi:hypothetical protein